MNNETKIEIVTGKQKKDPSKEWKALKITVGEWSKLVFVNGSQPLITSNFELDYIQKTLNEKK